MARTGVRETTIDATRYSHPDNEKLCFWDLPGFGARRYPTVDGYLRAIDVTRFDLILLLYKNTFKPNDFVLTNEIQKLGKPLYILRTHFDIDIQDGGDIEKTKDDILSELRAYNVNIVKTTERTKTKQLTCYFVSNLSHGYDYEILLSDLFASLENSGKKDALAFGVSNRNRTILRYKKKRLEERIMLVACMAAATGFIPIPGLDAKMNAAILIDEIVTMARVLSVFEFIKGNDRLECVRECNEYLTEHGLLDLMKTIADNSGQMDSDDIIKCVPIIGGPIFGGLISSVTNFLLAKQTLSKVLKAFVSVAERKMQIEKAEEALSEYTVLESIIVSSEGKD